MGCRPGLQILQARPPLRPPHPATVLSQLGWLPCLPPGLPTSTPAFSKPFSPCSQRAYQTLSPRASSAHFEASHRPESHVHTRVPASASSPPSTPRLPCSCKVEVLSVLLGANFSSVRCFPLPSTGPQTLLGEGPSPTSGLSENVPSQRGPFPDHPFTAASSSLSPSVHMHFLLSMSPQFRVFHSDVCFLLYGPFPWWLQDQEGRDSLGLFMVRSWPRLCVDSTSYTVEW